jgi:hypothetical protein
MIEQSEPNLLSSLRCGPESSIPDIMANDALLAGADTTGMNGPFIF